MVWRVIYLKSRQTFYVIKRLQKKNYYDIMRLYFRVGRNIMEVLKWQNVFIVTNLYVLV